MVHEASVTIWGDIVGGSTEVVRRPGGSHYGKQ